MKTKYKREGYSKGLLHHLRFPEDYKHQNICQYCLDRFGAKRYDAKYCSSQCRQAEYRYRREMDKRKGN